MREREDAASLLTYVHGSQRYLRDYFIEEVLHQLPSDLQTFVLHTCLLERLSAPLCDFVLEQTNSQQMREQLERANLFVNPLDRQGHWYRYHPLFAEAVRSRLEQGDEQAALAIQLRTSQWYAEQDTSAEAVEDALKAHDWTCAADQIEASPVTSRATQTSDLSRHPEPLQHKGEQSAGKSLQPMHQPLLDPLSKRELDVLRLLAPGASNVE